MTDRPSQPSNGVTSFLERLSIVSKINFGMLIFILILWFIAFLTVDRIVVRGLQLSAEDKAIQLSDRVLQEIESTRAYTQNTALQALIVAAMQEGDEDATSAIDNTLEQFILISRGEALSAILVDTEGRIVSAVPETGDVPAEVIQGQSWYEVASSGETYIATNLEMDGITDITGFHIAVPVLDSNSPDQVIATFYVIYADTSLTIQSEVIGVSTAGSEPGRREFAVYDETGELIIPGLTGPVSDGVLDTLQMPTGETVNKREAGANYSLVRFGDFSSQGVPESTANWIVVARQPAALSPGSFTTPTTLLQLFLVGRTILVLVGSVIIVYLATIPLRTLAANAQRITQQNAYNLHMALPADPQLRQLARIYNTTVALKEGQQEQIDASVQVSERMASTEDLGVTLTQVVDAIYERFGFEAVRCYLADNNQTTARLAASRGVGSERLLRDGHMVTADESTLIGRAVFLEYWQQGSNAGAAANITLAIPMLLSGRVLGVMVFIGKQTLPAEQIAPLRLLTNQVAIVTENVRLLRRSAATLERLDALNRRVTRDGWENYLGGESVIRHTLDPFERWPAIPEQVVGSGQQPRAQTFTDQAGREVISVPLLLRGESVGAISATRASGEIWTREEIALIESIAARMVVIADSIRLVEEASQRAAREELVNNLSAQMLSRSANVESVLQTALTELGGALGSDRIALRIGEPEQPAQLASTNEDADTSQQDEVHPPSMNGGGA